MIDDVYFGVLFDPREHGSGEQAFDATPVEREDLEWLAGFRSDRHPLV